MESIKFEKKYVDIVKFLNSNLAIGEYRGKEVWTKLEALIDGALDSSLVLIDLRQAILITSFCKHAFGPIFQALKDSRWPQRYIIFQMHDFHKDEFFQGVLDYFNIKKDGSHHETGFISANMYVKLMFGNKESIDFVGSLNENEKTILKVVNDLKQATAKQVEEKCRLQMEVIVDTLRSLIEKYFIMKNKNMGDEIYYCSFYNYFDRGDSNAKL